MSLKYCVYLVCECVSCSGSIPSVYPSLQENECAYFTTCHTSKAECILYWPHWFWCDIKSQVSFIFSPNSECVQPWTEAQLSGQCKAIPHPSKRCCYCEICSRTCWNWPILMLYLWFVFTSPTFVPISLPLFVLPVALLINSCHHKKNVTVCRAFVCVWVCVSIQTDTESINMRGKPAYHSVLRVKIMILS